MWENATIFFLKLRTILHRGNKLLEKMRSMRGEKEEPSAIGLDKKSQDSLIVFFVCFVKKAKILLFLVFCFFDKKSKDSLIFVFLLRKAKILVFLVFCFFVKKIKVFFFVFFDKKNKDSLIFSFLFFC